MGLTTGELRGIVAQWEEWAVDAGFRLTIEVRAKAVGVEITDGALGARITSEALYCQISISRGDSVVFNEAVPYDAAALRASVMVLAVAVAEFSPPSVESDPGWVPSDAWMNPPRPPSTSSG